MHPELHRSVSASSPHAEEGLPSESLILPLIIIQILLVVKCLFIHAVVLIHWLIFSSHGLFSYKCCAIPRSAYCLSVSNVYVCSKFPSCTITGKELLSPSL